MNFREKVLCVVSQIPRGRFLSYKEVARLCQNKKAVRAVANILSKNQCPTIPCHRVIKSDGEVGGYQGSLKNSWKKAALLLREGAIGVVPTDTIYGICGKALDKKVVEKIYSLRKRSPNKPMVILVASKDDLSQFGIKLTKWQQKILEKVWPGEISVVLPCPLQKFSYLHRGQKSLAFRLPKNQHLVGILKIAGPLVAPSANIEGEKPAEIISQAKRYFGEEVFYYNKGRIVGFPSTILDITKKPARILRKGKIKKAVIC